VRFLVDMPLSPSVAAWLGEWGYDAVHVWTLSLSRAADSEILQRAREEQRVVVTADLDYPRLLALSGERTPGVILFRGGHWSGQQVEARLAAALEALPAQAFSEAVVVIEPGRIRRARLPLGESYEE